MSSNPVSADLTLGLTVNGTQAVVTIEPWVTLLDLLREQFRLTGTKKGCYDGLHPLQAAFIERDTFQCGYCTPGQICSAAGLITEGHARRRAEIREQMSGNICRCGAYTKIANDRGCDARKSRPARGGRMNRFEYVRPDTITIDKLMSPNPAG